MTATEPRRGSQGVLDALAATDNASGMEASSEQVFELGVAGPVRDRLVAAVLSGEKVATSSLLLQ
jgi:uncharacterized protein YhfF